VCQAIRDELLKPSLDEFEQVEEENPGPGNYCTYPRWTEKAALVPAVASQAG
jgi:hypothetical protein